MDATEHLKDCVWTKPDSYGGFSPDGDYLIYSQNRDSCAIERSNYECIFKDLKTLDEKHQTETTEPFVYDFRARHWAVGWIEYILVKQNAPDEILQAAGEIICALSDYSIYNEGHASELEWDEAASYWNRSSVSDRLIFIKDSKCNDSIFAARHDYLPQDDSGALLDWLRD